MLPLTIASMALTSVSLAKDKNFILNNWKPIVGIGAALGIGFVGYKIYQKLTEDNGHLKIDERFDKPTITQAQANQIASNLLIAMDRPGTNEEAIMRALEGLTYNDFVMVSDAFGRRAYVFGGSTPLPLPGKNLLEWFAEELNAEDFTALKQAIPQAFK